MSTQAATVRGPAAEATADELPARRLDARVNDVVEAVDRRLKARYKRAYVAAEERALAAAGPKKPEKKATKKRRAAVEPTTYMPRPTKKVKTDKKDLADLKAEFANLKDQLVAVQLVLQSQEAERGRVQDLARVVSNTIEAIDALATELLAGQAELRRGQVAVAQHVTSERVATAKAMQAVQQHEAALPAIFLSPCILTGDMLETPVDLLGSIPEDYQGDVFLYVVDTVTNRVIVGGPYPLRVPHGSMPREICHNAINCVMSCCLPLVAIGAGVVSLLGLAPTAPAAVRNAKFLVEHAVSWILPVPSAQDARKGLRIADIIQLGDPEHKYGGSATVINQDGDKVLRGTADSIATYKRAMAAKAGDSVRMAQDAFFPFVTQLTPISTFKSMYFFVPSVDTSRAQHETPLDKNLQAMMRRLLPTYYSRYRRRRRPRQYWCCIWLISFR